MYSVQEIDLLNVLFILTYCAGSGSCPGLVDCLHS